MATTNRNRSATSSRKKSLSKQPVTVAALQTANGNSASPAPSNREVLRQLYLALLRCRLVEEYAQRRFSAQEYDLAIGHEAVVAGTIFGLRMEDTITALGRNFAALVSRGLPLKFLLEQKDKASSCSYGFDGVVAPASLPADPFNMGTGIALAHKFEKKQNVVIAICAEESPSLDRWRDALNFAGAHKLPILYVVKGGAANPPSSDPQNTHLEDFSFTARDYGFPGIIVDGGDVVAVWRVAQESLHRARNGAGPTVIDCRMESSHDPLAHMEHYMRKRGVWDDAWKKQITKQFKAEIEAAAKSPAN
jgi:pyruvate dehydrogenase E1 component alpha subunit